MKTLQYQQNAVAELTEKTLKLLALSGSRKKLVFKAPTGAGKTVMASELLVTLNDRFRNDPNVPVQQVAYIWIAPNKLHEQSYFKMKTFFSETRELQPIVYDDLDHTADGAILPGQILFVNWQSITKDNNLMVRETEQSVSLYEIVRRTQEDAQTPIIAIIDEEHLFAGRLANRTEEVLKNINAKIELRISATPSTTNPDEIVNIPRDLVIEEQMIKNGVILNPAITFEGANASLNQHLMSLALKKRNELAEAYQKQGVNINPLLLIQLPNDSSDRMDEDDQKIKEEVIVYLNAIKNINTNNGRLAIWLSNEKENLDGIEKNDNLIEVLLFKQAIALGWDCPRAAVLLIFRKIESFTFTVQTVGRILRMPEQRFYTDDRLNKGYVYTNLSKDIVHIAQDSMDYLSRYIAIRRENLNNVSLSAAYCERPSIARNRLGTDFRKFLSDTFVSQWGIKSKQLKLFTLDFDIDENNANDVSQHAKNREAVSDKITFNVHSISVQIVEDLSITGEVGQTLVKNRATYIRTMNELNVAFNAYCAQRIGILYEKVSIGALAFALKQVMEELFGLFETDAVKIILYHLNRPRFTEVIDLALANYHNALIERQRNRQAKQYKTYAWEVPAERIYPEESHKLVDEAKNHALMPFIELNNASNPEVRFSKFLENNSEYIDWWYKNGDKGKQHYSISYTNSKGDKALFYVDFIIRMKNGQILLFDTKSAGSDNEAVAKHNALIDYINCDENKENNLLGGILIEDGESWKFSKFKIENTTELINWSGFYPWEFK